MRRRWPTGCGRTRGCPAQQAPLDVFTNENVPTVLDVLAPDDIVLYGWRPMSATGRRSKACSSTAPIPLFVVTTP